MAVMQCMAQIATLVAHDDRSLELIAHLARVRPARLRKFFNDDPGVGLVVVIDGLANFHSAGGDASQVFSALGHFPPHVCESLLVVSRSAILKTSLALSFSAWVDIPR